MCQMPHARHGFVPGVLHTAFSAAQQPEESTDISGNNDQQTETVLQRLRAHQRHSHHERELYIFHKAAGHYREAGPQVRLNQTLYFC